MKQNFKLLTNETVFRSI